MKINKYSRVFLTLMCVGIILGTFSACSAQNGSKPGQSPADPSEKEISSGGSETGNEPRVSETETETEAPTEPEGIVLGPSTAIRLNYPKAAEVTETDMGVYAETDEYLLYAFELESFRDGAVYDEMEVLSVIKGSEKETDAGEILRLKNFSFPEESDAILYEDLNGTHAYRTSLLEMEYEGNGKKASGDGLLMIYEKPAGVGVYIVLGIVKDGKKKLPEELEQCAMSLIPSATAEEPRTVMKDSMPDETSFRLAYPKEAFSEIEKADNSIYMYYGADRDGHFLIQHDQKSGESSSKEQMKALIDSLSRKDESLSFTDPTTQKGKMEYQKTVLTYKSGDREITEVICLTAGEDGSVWIVDLYGSKESVKAQEKNLQMLLWSLEEL